MSEQSPASAASSHTVSAHGVDVTEVVGVGA